MGKPVGLANNLKAIVEGADFLSENVQTVKRGRNAMDGNLVPRSDGKGFLKLDCVLPDILVLQQVLCIEGRCCGQDNVFLLAVSG